jgi:hypothetical protein
MTAIDEITARTPDALFNGTAVVELIRSCVPNIKDPWAVTNVDLDALLVAIKAASSPSGEMDVESQCPKCEDVSTFKIVLGGILAGLTNPDFDTELEVGDLSIKFRPLSFKEVNQASIEQFDLQRMFASLENMTDEDQKSKAMQEALARITNLTMVLLSKSIVHIKTPSIPVTELEYILDFLQHCDRNLYIQIRDYSSKMREQSEIKPMKFTCASCSHEYEQSITLNPTDFFE